MPAQVPFEPVSVWPSTVLPAIVGSVELDGAAATTTPVWALVADALPPVLVPVTITRIVLPTSPDATT